MSFNLYNLKKFMILPTEVIDIITNFSNPYKRIHKKIYVDEVIPELLIHIHGDCVDCKEDWAYEKTSIYKCRDKWAYINGHLNKCVRCKNNFCNLCMPSSDDCFLCMYDCYYEVEEDIDGEEWDERIREFRDRHMCEDIYE
jgi:hypothetical protein